MEHNDMKSFKTIINEASLGRVKQHTDNTNIAMITAHRNEHSAAENKQRNSDLENHLRKNGFGFTKVKGRYIENHGTKDAKSVDENSYLVTHKDGKHLENHIKALGKKFGQDSVLIKHKDEPEAHLHGTREGGYPGLGKKQAVGKWHPNRAGEFHTAMKGKTFAFGESVCEEFHFVTQVSFSSRVEHDV